MIFYIYHVPTSINFQDKLIEHSTEVVL